MVEGVCDVGVGFRIVGGDETVTVAAVSRITAPRSVHPHGLKIAAALRLRLGLYALLMSYGVADVAVGVGVEEGGGEEAEEENSHPCQNHVMLKAVHHNLSVDSPYPLCRCAFTVYYTVSCHFLAMVVCGKKYEAGPDIQAWNRRQVEMPDVKNRSNAFTMLPYKSV